MIRLANVVREKLAYPNVVRDKITYPKEDLGIELLHLSDLEGIRFAANTKPVFLPEGDKEEKMTQSIRINYSNACDYLRHVRTNISENKPVPIQAGLAIIDEILAMPNLNKMYELTVKYDHDKDYCIYHSVNTMIYALIMGKDIGYQHVQLIELCIAALLHDVGMFKISESIVDTQEVLTSATLGLIKRHPEIGKDILLSCMESSLSQNIVAAVYQHHERENGGGYPEGIKGDQINEYAEIIGISAFYEAMTHSRPYRNAITQCASMKELIKSKNTLFSSKIVKAFLGAMSLYPIGSCVRLNNNAVGTVVAVNKAHPLKPQIKILLDGQGNRIMEDKLIDLSENTILSIVGDISYMKLDS